MSQQLTCLLLPFIKPGMTITFDIGANIGYYTILCWRATVRAPRGLCNAL